MEQQHIHQPHDKNFRLFMSDPRVMRDYAKTYMEVDIAKITNLDYLTPARVAFNTSDKTSAADIVYKTKIKNQDGYIFLLAEHQSSVDKWMPLRLAKYAIAIMENHINASEGKVTKLPLVYPMVFYHGKQPHPAPMSLFDLCGENKELAQAIWTRPFHLIDVNKIEDKKLIARPWSGTFEFLQKHVYNPNLVEKSKVIMPNLDYLHNQGAVDLVRGSLRYITNAIPPEKYEPFERLLEEQLGDKAMYSAADYFVDQGIEKGIEKGMEKGVKQVALRLIQNQFPLEKIKDITGLPTNTLELLKNNGIE